MNLYVHRLADELAGLGVDVDVFTRKTDRHVPDIVMTQAGARVIHLRAGPARTLPKRVLPLHIPAMAASLRQFTQAEGIRYDVLHCHYWISGLVGMRARAALGAPVIAMFHTLSRVKETYLGAVDRDDSGLRYDGERCLIGGADAVVGATHDEREHMSRLYERDPVRFSVIPPGVDTRLFHRRDRAQSRGRLGINAERVILFVGRFDRMKGLDTLLHAAAGLPPDVRATVKVIIVGGHDRSDRASALRIHRVARTLGVCEMVEIRSRVPQSELPHYYSAADVCAVPSVYESFGMVAIEAMACETPVVAFAAGGLRTTIVDGETGFLAQPGSVSGFSAALCRALAPGAQQRMGRLARLSVQRFNWARIARDTFDLYADVTANRPCLCKVLAGTG